MKVFICYQNEFLACSSFIRENYPSPIEQMVSIDELVSVAGGIINFDWTEPSNLKNLLHEVGLMGADCIVIFASGSNAGSEVKKQIKTFRRKLAKFLERKEVKPNQLYQLQVSFYPLTQFTKEN